MRNNLGIHFKKYAIMVATVSSFVFIVFLFFLLTTTIRTYRTIVIQVPEIGSYFYVTQVKTGAIFKNSIHYKYYINPEKKSNKEMNQGDNEIVFLGGHFGYYTAGADTLCLDGELYSKADLITINDSKVIIRDYAHITEQCHEFVYDSRYNALVPRDELGKVIFVTGADFEHEKALW